jgi:hypothetical protein
VAVMGRSFFLSVGQELTIPTLTLSFYTCDTFSPRNPLQISYGCIEVLVPPQPAWIQVCARFFPGLVRSRLFQKTPVDRGHLRPRTA